MELLASLDATTDTKMMLLDDFLHGSLFKLFEDKWIKFGRREHASQVMLQILHLLSLVNVSFNKPFFDEVPTWSVVLQIISCLLLCEVPTLFPPLARQNADPPLLLLTGGDSRDLAVVQ